MPEGIRKRHARACRSRKGGGCSCTPTYEAQVYSAREHKRIYRTFPTEAAARTWRQDALIAVRRGAMKAGRVPTVREAWTEWIAGAEAGVVLTRSKERYKPSTVRGYRQAMRDVILPDLGPMRLDELRRSDLQRLVERQRKKGKGASTVRNTLLPVRAIYRRAMHLEDVSVNPTLGLELPASRGRRERVAAPAEAAELLAALPELDRALWATAMFAGLRLGELQALTWRQVDLDAGVLNVRNSWDRKAGLILPKTRAGWRTVPIAQALRRELRAQVFRSGRRTGLVFGRTDEQPFSHSGVQDRADRVWKKAGLTRITYHECRHTFASLLIAAGLSAQRNPMAIAKELSQFVGHASVTQTLDRYGHLFPGSESEAASALDAYLERAQAGGQQGRPGR